MPSEDETERLFNDLASQMGERFGEEVKKRTEELFNKPIETEAKGVSPEDRLRDARTVLGQMVEMLKVVGIDVEGPLEPYCFGLRSPSFSVKPKDRREPDLKYKDTILVFAREHYGAVNPIVIMVNESPHIIEDDKQKPFYDRRVVPITSFMFRLGYDELSNTLFVRRTISCHDGM